MFNFLMAAMGTQTIIMIVLLVIMVVVLIVLPMFTNKRRNKAINELHASLCAGDVIKTVGGIVGTIIEIRELNAVDKEMVIETGVGDNKSTLVFDIQAVYQVVTKVNAPAIEAPAEETAPEADTETTETATKAPDAEETTTEEKAD